MNIELDQYRKEKYKNMIFPHGPTGEFYFRQGTTESEKEQALVGPLLDEREKEIRNRGDELLKLETAKKSNIVVVISAVIVAIFVIACNKASLIHLAILSLPMVASCLLYKGGFIELMIGISVGIFILLLRRARGMGTIENKP